VIGGTIGMVVRSIADLYVAVIIIYCLMFWLPHSSGIVYDIYEALGKICEPFLGLFRKIIPPVGGVDFSPVIAILVLQLVVRLLF